MDNVQFDNDVYTTRSPRLRDESDSFLTRMAMKLGAKNYAQVNYVLLGFTIACILIALLMLFSIKSGPRPTVPSITGAPVEKTYQR